MASFEYTARDHTGNAVSGTITAGDISEVRLMLRQRNEYVLNVSERMSEDDTAGGATLFGRKVKLGDMVVMSRQLATLLKAGMSILECLSAICEQTENPTLRDALTQVRLDVMTGSTLANAMRKHPTVFSATYISLVQAGEAGGMLEQTLEIAAQQFDRQADLVEKIKAAFTYPALVMVSAFGVVFFMLVFIVPVFARVYDQFHAKLPLVTQLLVQLSNLILHAWWLCALALGGMVWALRQAIATPGGKRLWDRLKLKMPLTGKLTRKIAVARFTQTLGGSLKAGVPILQALQVSAETAGNLIIYEAVMEAARSVTEGKSLSAPLRESGEFPSMVTRMIAAGEQSGNLETMLEEITRFYERDIEYSVGKLTRLMEPLMTIAIGGIVLFILLALYMPVFNLTQVMHSGK